MISRKNIVMLFLIPMICAEGFPSQDDWIEQGLTGNDSPLNEKYSYSREEEESVVESILSSLAAGVPRTWSGELIVRTRQKEVESNPIGSDDYWYQRFRTTLQWEKKEIETGFLSLRHFNEPVVSRNSLFKYYVKKKWMRLDNFIRRDSMLIGNYKAQYGQGLVFYGSLLEFNRPITVRPRGLTVDRGTNPNAYLNGFGWAQSLKRFSYAAFYSRAWLSADVTDNGSVDEDLYDIKTDYGFIETQAGRDRWRRFAEDLIGGHIDYQVSGSINIGFTGYEARYNMPVDPARTSERYAHVFRGNRNTVSGIDWHFSRDSVFSFAGEYAFSKARGENSSDQTGTAWVASPKVIMKPWTFFVTGYEYDPDFFNRHGKGASFGNKDPHNQKGLLYGILYKRRPQYLFFTYRSARTEQSDWTGSTRSTSPRFPSDMKELFIEYRLRVIKPVELAARLWNDTRERYLDIDPTDAVVLSQEDQVRNRTRAQVTWTPSARFRFRTRYDKRVEKVSAIGERLSGDLIFGELSIHPLKNWTIGVRQTVFDSGGTYLSQYEPVWRGIYQSASFFGSKGMRSLIMLTYTWNSHGLIWVRYGRTDMSDGSISQDIRLQTGIYF